jgi:hypothetical protein
MSDEGNTPQQGTPPPGPDPSGAPMDNQPIAGEPTSLVQKEHHPIAGETTQEILGGGGIQGEATTRVREGEAPSRPTRR